jgi:hypothetical protein
VVQLAEPEPALLKKLESAEREELRALERAEAARIEARERDLSVGSRRRMHFTVAMAGGVGLLGVWASAATLTARDLVGLQTAVLAAAVLLIGRYLRRVDTRVNRQLAAAVVLSNAAVLLHRVLAWFGGAAPERTLVSDQVLVGACVALIAVVFDRRLFAAALVPSVGACACAVWPEATSPILVATSTLTLGVVAYVWGLPREGESETPRAPAR